MCRLQARIRRADFDYLRLGSNDGYLGVSVGLLTIVRHGMMLYG